LAALPYRKRRHTDGHIPARVSPSEAKIMKCQSQHANLGELARPGLSIYGAEK
jgi:hypothetical protein